MLLLSRTATSRQPLLHNNILFLWFLALSCRSEAFARTHIFRLPSFRGGSLSQQPLAESTVLHVLEARTSKRAEIPPPLNNGAVNNPDERSDDDDVLAQEEAIRTTSPPKAEYVAETKLPTDIGQFQLRAYRIPGAALGQEPCVIYSRDKPPFGTAHAKNVAVPVRIHDQCLTSEVFRSQRYVPRVNT